MNHNYYPKTHRRIPELDLLKTVAVIGMIFVHVLECSENLNTVGTLRRAIATFIEFFGCAPSACIFMFAMGWGAALSRESSVKHSIDRFGQLCILGLLVNFFQQIVPMIINPEVFGAPIENFYTIIAVDIYQFASLAMLYFAAMQALGKNTKKAWLFSGLLVTICMAVNVIFGFETFSTNNPWTDTLIGFIIRENEYSYFPFISWIIFPVVGYACAFVYEKYRDRENIPVLTLAGGICTILISELLMNIFSVRDVIIRHVFPAQPGYYAMHPLCALCAFGIIVIEFSLAMVGLKLLKGKFTPFFNFVSKHVMFIYIAQWIIIGLLTPTLYNVTSIYVNVLFSICILVAVLVITYIREKNLNSLPPEKQEKLKFLIR